MGRIVITLPGVPASSKSRGHVWKLAPNGDVAEFAYDEDNHNGPVCELCGYCYCIHCYADGPAEDCPGPNPTLAVIDGSATLLEN